MYLKLRIKSNRTVRTKDKSVQCSFHPVLTGFLFLVDEVYRENWDQEVIITSGSEPIKDHGYTSLHYATPAQAADIRVNSRGLPGIKSIAGVLLIAAESYCKKINIPKDWIEVISETNHIHIEYQPKRPK